MQNEETNTPLTGNESETSLELSPTTNQAVMALASATSELARALTEINYTPTDWVDLAEPDIDAAHLNKIEQGILQATTAINSAFSAINGINSNLQYKELTSGFDLNNALGRYRSSNNDVIASLINVPSNFYNSGEITIDWFPAGDNNTFGVQIIRGRYANTTYQYIRSKARNEWRSWEQFALKSDLPKIEFGIYEAAVNANSIHTSDDIPLHLGNLAPFVIAVPVIYVNPGDFEVQILNITSQRFLIRVKNNSSSTFTVPVWWMAIKKD